MPTNSLTHFVLVDFENRPVDDLAALGEHPICVSLFLGPKNRLKPKLVEQIETLPFEVRLIKTRESRKNLLDFVLTFHLGEMASRYPRGHYYIVSGDKKDFTPVIAHLKANHFNVSLHADIASLPFLASSKAVERSEPAVVSKPVAKANPVSTIITKVKDRKAEIVDRILNPTSKNRPRKMKGLRAHIKTAFGKESTAAKIDEVFGALRDGGLTEDGEGNVSYA